MIVRSTPISGVMVIEPDTFNDQRGFFLETYQKNRYEEAGITDDFIQDNQSRSLKGILRGLHYQVKRPQSQLVTILRGRVFDVGVDLRPASATFGKWYGAELSDSGPARQLYMAPGIAHGFFVLSDWADLHYKVSRKYDHNDEGGLRWNDPEIGIQWPIVETPEVALRDAAYPLLSELNLSQLPHFPPIEILSNHIV